MYGIEQVIQKEKEKEGGIKTDHTIGIHTHMPKDTHTDEWMIRAAEHAKKRFVIVDKHIERERTLQ